MALSRIRSLKIGPHASATDLTAETGAAEYIPIDGESGLLDDIGVNYIERDFQNLDNETTYSIQGTKKLELPDIPVAMTGMSTDGAGDGVAPSSKGVNIDGIIDCILGAASAAFEGDTTDASDAGTGSTVIMDADPGADPSGNAFLIKGATSGKYFAREVVSSSTATHTLCRALTTDDNSADTADEAEVAYASKTWSIDPSVTAPIHYFIDAETTEARRKIFGIMGNLKFEFPRGGYAKAVLTGQMCNDWTDTDNPANPTNAFGTTGDPILCFDMPFYLGNSLYMAHDVSFDCGIQFAPVPSDGGPNGQWGYEFTRKMPKMTGKIRAGSGTSPLMLTHAAAKVNRGDTTIDTLLQVGRQPGAAMAIRIPNGRMTLEKASENGQLVWNFEIEATERTADSNTGCAKIHVF